MNNMKVPVCDTPQERNIKSNMFSTQDYMMKTLSILTAIRMDVMGVQEEQTQPQEARCMLDFAELQADMAARITREVHDLATMLGVQI